MNLLRQGAHDIGRYDSSRMHSGLRTCNSGDLPDQDLPSPLTNEHLYWEPPAPEGPNKVDRAFHIHDEQCLSGRLAWSAEAGAGTVRSREHPINLIGKYDLIWHDYGDEEKLQPLGSGKRSSNSRFRYLVIDTNNRLDNN